MRFSKLKSGNNAVRQYKGRPANTQTVYTKVRRNGETVMVMSSGYVKPMTLRERQANHQLRHPNDKNQKKTKGVFWGKKGHKDKKLKEFFETHVYTYIDADMNKGWVCIGGEEE
tara:strand:+ start:1046 stop:1387 length:342 start_codon:yes stop_codon:yes gene_type:complete